MDGFLRDLRQSTRALLRAPGFTAVAVLTLGLGIGASTAIYSLVERVVIEPLPYPEADRLVRLNSQTSEGTWALSRAQWAFYRRESRTIEELAGYDIGQVTVRGPAGPERVGVWEGTASLFRVMGARPALGRLIDEEDDEYGATDVAVLSHGYWQRAFGGDPTVIGRTLIVNESPMEIVGVMGPGIELPDHVPAEVRPDVWLPLQLNLAGQFWNSHAEFSTVARLAAGATPEGASRELASFNPRLIEEFPQAYSESFMERYAFRPEAVSLRDALVGDVASNLWILLAGVGLVLLIACANIANLFLVRAEGRRREMAVRTALGAGRSAILRYFLAESLAVTCAGVVVALALAYWGLQWLVAMAPVSIPRLEGVGLDGSILAVSAGTAALVALALALLPGLRYGGRRRSVAELGDGGRSATVGRERQHARGTLVVAQVALALVLLVGAALLLESFRRLQAVDPGLKPAGVLTATASLPSARYDTYEKHWAFQQALLERVRALPGVAAAGIGPVPLRGGYGCTVQAFPDAEVVQRIADSKGTLCAAQTHVSDGYFEALGIPLEAGRGIARTDNASPGAGAVVVSRAFAEKFWPGEDPIGKRVAPAGRSQGPFYTVVGMVGDVYGSTLTEPPAVAIYYPVVPIPPTGGFYLGDTSLLVKTAGGDPMGLFPQIRALALELDAAVPMANPQAMEGIVRDSMSGLSFTMSLLAAAAFAALLLAAIGLYGVLSYVVQRRTNEIGVRMALGARPRQVERMVVGGSLKLAALGLALGLAGALALTRFLASLLYEVQPTQPSAYIGAVVLLTAVAASASWLPARRAARVNPVEALRNE